MTVSERIADAREALQRGEVEVAAELFGAIAEAHPGEPDAWNGLGAAAFEAGNLEQALEHYERAKTLALDRDYGGAVPEQLAWIPEHKPYLRALHGIGVSQFRAGKTAAAKKTLEELLRVNPDDNQGVRYLLADLKKGKSPWKAKK